MKHSIPINYVSTWDNSKQPNGKTTYVNTGNTTGYTYIENTVIPDGNGWYKHKKPHSNKIQPPPQALIERFISFIWSIPAKAWIYWSIIGFLLLTAVLMGIYHERPQKQRLSQTEYVTKLGTENAQYQSEIGIEMAKQVQTSKHVQATKKVYDDAVKTHTDSVNKVLELEGKIEENKSKMKEQIITNQ